MRENTKVYGDNSTTENINKDYTKTSTVLFHPKVMGMILIFLIAIFTIGLIASGPR